VWALAAAVLYGSGAGLQLRQAAAAPSQAAGRPRLLLLLVQRPWWLLGIGVELGGFAAHAVALRTGPLTIVQMLVASSLLFSVATVRLWSGRRLRRAPGRLRGAVRRRRPRCRRPPPRRPAGRGRRAGRRRDSRRDHGVLACRQRRADPPGPLPGD